MPEPQGKKPLILLAVFGAALLCAPDTSAQVAGASFRVTARAACYATSPQQGRPPEAMLPAGATVKHVPDRPIGIYRRVQTEGGLQCWIDGSRLKLLIK